MSHQIPEYLNYVSSITIVNGGSGYSTASITISGGGGTGAAATVSLFNGEIQTVTVTNIGEGYTSTPTVTVTGDGTGAELTAVLGFASITPSEYNEKSALGVKYSLPEFIQNDYAKFVSFIDKYYEYLDTDGKPANLLLNKDYSDIDELNDAELNKRTLELAEDFPQILQADRKFLLKNIKSIYESKGSERSIKAYFKLLYNEEVEVDYPSKNILRASDGIWIEETSVRATSGFNNYEVLQLNGKVADIKYYETTGSVTLLKTIPITIPRVEKLAYTSPQAYEVVIELPAGVTDVPGPGSQATATATVVAGVITQIDVVNGGYGYVAAPDVEIYDTNGGAGATARAVVTNGEVSSIVVNDGGSGYNPLTTSVSFNTDTVRSFIVDRDATSIEENIRAYLDRSLSSVTSGVYAGAAAGFSVGDVFAVNESGDDGTGYAVPGYFAGDYTYTGGSNNAVIRVAAIDSSGVPTTWSIINPGEGFRNAQTTITIESKTGESLDITLFTKYLYSYDGKYKDDRGKLSDVNRLQDNFKYQSYSYIIKSTISQNQWVKRFRDLMHPAGMEVFGDLIITNNVNFAPFIEIITDGLNLNEFKTEDIAISNDDVIIISVQYNRDFTDSATSSDPISISVEPNFADSAGVSDDYIQEYVEEDYLPLNYTGGGISKLVEKNITDTPIATEVLERVVDYNRTFTDTGAATELLAVDLSADLGHEVVVTDDFIYEIFLLHELFDSAHADDAEFFSISLEKEFILDDITHTEIVSINTDKEVNENQTATDVPQIDTSKPVVETTTTADSGVITIQDYSDPTYFSEDYVGAGYSF